MINEKTSQLVKINKIHHSGKKNVIDIQIEDDNSFALANGIISHNSAVGSILAARGGGGNIGVLPLRGKIPVLTGNRAKDVLDSQILTDIVSSIGLIPGQVPRDLRYNRVFFACDADDDGGNIASSLAYFFYSFWPSLFEGDEPYFYIFQTPYIIIEDKKGNPVQYYYNDNISDFKPEEWSGHTIVRAKGLGTLSIQNMSDAIINNRAIPLRADSEMAETFSLIFDKKRADDRKEWMSSTPEEFKSKKSTK